MNRSTRMKPGEHLTGDRERKSEEGNLRYLIRDVGKHFFSSTFVI